jgi:NDP-sugar pyrophosphorylase family protein
MEKKINAFILAAGLGERLRPLTNHIPKPLLPVLGKPVLQSVLERISGLPVKKTGINLHYKRGVIEDWIDGSPFKKTVKIFPEERILGTGGALRNAGSFLNDGTFVVHNSDILSDINMQGLIEFHLTSKRLATLAVHDCPEFNTVFIDGKGIFRGLKQAEKRPKNMKEKAFTGIAVYEPEFLEFLSEDETSVVDAWIKAMNAGQIIAALDVSGCFWRDIGTVSSYFTTVFHALSEEGETVYIHPSVQGCSDMQIDGFVVIEEGCEVKERTFLRNCILLPGGRTGADSWHENCIIGPGFIYEIDESEMPGLSGEDGAMIIGTGGSDRKYYRIKKDRKTFVLMKCDIDDPDFERHIEYTRFFLEHKIPVPELIGIDAEKKRAVFEDLGGLSLYSWLRCGKEKDLIEEMYRHIIDILISIHAIGMDDVSKCPLLQARVFDYDYFRWETDYFIERFVKDIRGIRGKDRSALNDELGSLAMKADSFTKTVIHRDFQSQNIMISGNKIPSIIDYQGARLGPPAYDVVSLLWDPYYRHDDDMRERLLDYYVSERKGSVGIWFSEKDFRNTLLACRLQRHMQALGAFGFLSSVKRKEYFLKYIPEGLRLLRDDVSLSKKEYPLLYDLVAEL